MKAFVADVGRSHPRNIWDPEYVLPCTWRAPSAISQTSIASGAWRCHLPWSLLDASMLDVPRDHALPPSPEVQWLFDVYR